MNENELNEFLNNEGMQPFMEILQMISEVPDESLNDDSIDIIKGAIKGAFTENVQKEVIQNILKSFRDEDLLYKEAQERIESLKNIFNILQEKYYTDEYRQALLKVFLDKYVSLFEEALKNYLKFDIVLPMKVEDIKYIPTYAHETDAAADIFANEDITIPAHSISNLIKTGLKIALPKNWFAIIVPRSSIGMKTGLRLSNSQGVIDSDYRGEIGVIYDNISDSEYNIKKGDRIAQMYVMPVYRFKPQIVDELEETERGDGSYGSTGR